MMSPSMDPLMESVLHHPLREEQDLKEYELFALSGLNRVKTNYQEMFLTRLNQWSEGVATEIRRVGASSQSNQVRPKLELIFTSIINQEGAVKQQIQAIGRLLREEQFRFGEDNQEEKENMPEPFLQTHAPTNSLSTNGFGNKLSKSNSKNRSLSFGNNGRRRLSKTSCFAEAKKVETSKTNMMQTTMQTFCKTTSDNFKKTKKRDENGFKYLDKCLRSSNSPSNAMFQMPRPDNQEAVQSQHRHTKTSIMERLKASPFESKVSENQSQQHPAEMNNKVFDNCEKSQSNFQSSSIKNSANYQKRMETFQEKISSKIDQLMNKYTTIEQKLQQASQKTLIPPSLPSQKPDQLPLPAQVHPKPFTHTSSDLRLNLNMQSLSENISEVKDEVQGQSLVYVERSPSKGKHTHSTLLKDSSKIGSSTSLKNNTTKSSNKTVYNKNNKIVRNQIQEEGVQEGSVQVISLSNGLQNGKGRNQEEYEVGLSMKKAANGVEEKEKTIGRTRAMEKVVEKQTLNKDKERLEAHILEFHQNTVKFLLPISKKLLHILKTKYLTFCSRNTSPASTIAPSPSISSIETEAVGDYQKEMKDLLQKMQKLLNLNCTAQKKEKLVLYFNSFLVSYLSLCRDSSSSDEQTLTVSANTESLISQAFTCLGQQGK